MENNNHEIVPPGMAHDHTKKHKTRHPRRKWIIIGSILLVLIVARLVMPYFVLKYVNRTLAKSRSYPGHVQDIDIALIRGAYVINEIRIDKRDTVTGKTDSIPFFTSKAIDLSVEWTALFKGKIVGEIVVEEPRVNFVQGKHKDENVKEDTSDFQTVIKDLMPLTINRFEINKGHIHFVDPNSKPRVDVSLLNIYALATNLTNVNDSNKVLPAGLNAFAEAYEGKMDMHVKFDALQKQPTFDLNAKITDVNMVKLNDFFKAYGKFDVERGKFGLYTEFAGKEGKFDGYVKPLIHELKVVKFDKEEGDVQQILWEAVVGGVAEVFENQKKDQLGTKVPLHGKFDNPTANLWDAISYVLRNAFVRALLPSVDQTVNLKSVDEPEKEKETFLQKVFGKKDKDQKDKGDKDDDQKDDKDRHHKKEKKSTVKGEKK